MYYSAFLSESVSAEVLFVDLPAAPLFELLSVFFLAPLSALLFALLPVLFLALLFVLLFELLLVFLFELLFVFLFELLLVLLFELLPEFLLEELLLDVVLVEFFAFDFLLLFPPQAVADTAIIATIARISPLFTKPFLCISFILSFFYQDFKSLCL